ncbi:MAG TPA: DEAD/DEAH box helicase [Mycobacteriales bacterium]|nr:DEAD/DEAH box helicase [Mycobacteriales bacterium]
MTAQSLLGRLLDGPRYQGQLTHVERVPPREGRLADWPPWAAPLLVQRLGLAGIAAPYLHQVAAAELAHAGRHVVLATGTASGKSLGYLLPAVTALIEEPKATALYLAPTKALAVDQLRAMRALSITQVRAATFDGDTSREDRDWVRSYANLVLTNPDMLHRTILPGHPRWAAFLRGLRYVVVDECHGYRGVFGSHVAHVLRRLRRLCAKYGASPTFVLASATVASPEVAGGRLVGAPVLAVTDDASPRGPMEFALWEPPLIDGGSGARRSSTAETADLLADCVVDGVRTLAFVRSRRGAEIIATQTRRLLNEVDPELGSRVAAYRAGYLPEERRRIESDLQSGALLGVAATNALELGVDVSGLDAVLLAGYPGTVASLWQQAGRAGRRATASLAVFIARDDPLDTYLVHHPAALFGRPVEATVLDPDNEHVLDPHLCAAAAELPLTTDDLALFGPTAELRLADLVRRGLLRHRPTGWYWARRDRAADLADIRGAGGPPVRIVESSTGRLLGTVDAAASHGAVHDGAVYLHQGESYVVDQLDLPHDVALVTAADPDWTTSAKDVTDIRIVETLRSVSWGEASLHFGTVDVSSQVVGFVRKRILTGEVIGEEPLTLPPRELRTRAVWYTVTVEALARFGVEWADVPGSAHAAEHAGIGLLPLFATCDRWDIGGVSTALHEDTGLPTVFVYDGHPGGAGFAERGYSAGAEHLRATREAIARCRCESGCPSCVQSPKCGNGNNPLDKAGAVRLLDAVLDRAPVGQPGSG